MIYRNKIWIKDGSNFFMDIKRENIGKKDNVYMSGLDMSL
jgi:hypothetical protein